MEKNVIRIITAEVQTHVEIYLRSKNSTSSITTYTITSLMCGSKQK
jgi:hypothetical protein